MAGHSTSRTGRGLLWASAFAVILVLPVTAAAQKDVFVDAFIALHSALHGTYGDEGPLITAEFRRLGAALDAWDRSAAAAEAELKKRAASSGEFALHYIDQQRPAAALEATNSAIAAEPSRASLYVFQGQLLEAVGRAADAHSAFSRARQLDPADPVAAYLVATRSSSNAVDLQSIVATLIAAGDRRALTPRPFADLALIRDMSAKSPEFAPAAYVDAFTAFGARRFREALDAYRNVMARDPLITDPAAQSKALLDGVAALRARNGDAAVARLEAVVASWPKSSESHRVLGIVYRAVARLPESIEQFEMAVRLRPDDERARVAWGSALAEAGRLEDAERELRATIKMLPSSGEARWLLAELLDRQSRGTEAIALLEEATSLPVVAGRAYLLLRIAEVAHAYRRDFDRVVSLESQIVRLLPNEANGHKDLGLAYYRAGRDDEAAIELLMMGLLGKEDGEALGALGQIHFYAGRLDRAEATLRRAVALEPTLAQARYVLAQTLQRLGRNTEADEQLAAFEKLREDRFDEQRRKFENDSRAPAK